MYKYETEMVARRWKHREQFKRQSHHDICNVSIFYGITVAMLGYTQTFEWDIILIMVGFYAPLFWLSLKFIKE